MYENVWDRQSLLFQIKLLKDRVEAFESGEKYIRMEKLHKEVMIRCHQSVRIIPDHKPDNIIMPSG